MSQNSSDLSRHRFFRTMVVMGSGLALGCGGASEKDANPGGGDGGSTSTGGSSNTGGSSTSSGGSSNSGGTAGAGGTLSLGGAGSGGTAGTANGGAGGAIVPTPNCPTTQWTSPDYPQCAGPGDGLVLPANSVCDLTRPKSASDCGSAEIFACLKATGYADGTALSEPKPYACECVPDSESCRDECGELYSSDATCHEGDDPTSILCGCAIIVLK
jgi:hypothetical protein